MDHEISVQQSVAHMNSQFPFVELGLQSAKKHKNITPISKLCVSLTGASIGTQIGQQNVEPMFMDTPEKILFHTPTAHLETPLMSAKQTPLKTFDCNEETPFSDVLETPKTELNSCVETPLCVALGESLGTKYVNSTPRRSLRKSYVDKSQSIGQKEKVTKVTRRSSISKRNTLNDLSMTPTVCENIQKDKLLICSGSETVSSDSLSNNDFCIHKRHSVSGYVRKSLLTKPDNRITHLNPLDWMPALAESNDISTNPPLLISTEPRGRRKSHFETSARKLSFSCKKIANKQKNVIPEYDPDNDIFAQGLMPIQFNINVNSLKNEIGRFLKNSDVPSPHLKKSSSCSALNAKEISITEQNTHLSPRRKQSKPSPPAFKAKLKRAISAPNVLKSVDSEIASFNPAAAATKPLKSPMKLSSALAEVKPAGEGKIRAYLRARDIIKKIRKRGRDEENQVLPPAKPFSLALCTETTSDKVIEDNLPSHLKPSVQNSECSRRENLLNEPVEDFDNSFLPPTQPFESFILRDVTAYVEVISNNENLSAGVRTELMKLGATVVPAFNRDVPVTHVIFNNGHLSTYKKAKKRNVPLVSVLWIEQCRKAGVKVHESLFPPYQIERYESPGIVKELRKRRIMHFSSEKEHRPSPRRKKGAPDSMAMEAPIESPSPNGTLQRKSRVPKWVEEVAGDNRMVRILVNMTGIGQKEFKELVNRPPTPDSDLDCDQHSPLPIRLLRKLTKNLPINNLNSNDNSKIEENNGELSPGNEKYNESSFVKKLNEVSSEEEKKATEVENAEESLPTQHAITSISQLNISDSQNITQKKKTVKRKLLSPVAETLSLSQDAIEVENPHCSSSKVTNTNDLRKKKKSESIQKETVKDSASPVNEEASQGNPEQNSVYPIRRSRRSSAYFVNSKKKLSSPVTQKPAIVCTLLHSADVDVIASIIGELGTYVIERHVTNSTTHIVTGAPKRTMKVLKGMVRGCWIVTHEWVLKSLEARQWLDEEEFELTSFSPAVQKYRIDKLSFGGIFKPDIFCSCGPIFVSSQASAPRGDLVELVLLCGGRITSKINKAAIAIGRRHPGIVCVTALWILDSVQFYCCKPFDSYTLS